MNTETPAEPSPSTDGQALLPAPAVRSSSGSGPGWLALLLALAGLALGGYAAYELLKLKSDTATADLLQQQALRIDEQQRRLESVGSAINGLQSSIDEMELAQQENAEALRKLAGTLAVDNIDLALAEIEQLLIMAVHHLTLQRDVNTALAAMEAADQRLAGLESDDVQAVRDQLNADMQVLKAVNAVDITGLSLYLSDLSGRVDKLPLASAPVTDMEATSTPVTTDTVVPAWRRLLTGVWQEFRQMFVITRTGDGTRATLLPEESWYLYQNLRLQIETARLAVVRQDTQTLRTSLQQIDEWLRDYYETSNGEVDNILQTVQKMAAIELNPALPDVSSSLETLRAYIRARVQETSVGLSG
jgi:uroporphyrin-3 C-methyltransferase